MGRRIIWVDGTLWKNSLPTFKHEKWAETYLWIWKKDKNYYSYFSRFHIEDFGQAWHKNNIADNLGRFFHFSLWENSILHAQIPLFHHSKVLIRTIPHLADSLSYWVYSAASAIIFFKTFTRFDSRFENPNPMVLEIPSFGKKRPPNATKTPPKRPPNAPKTPPNAPQKIHHSALSNAVSFPKLFLSTQVQSHKITFRLGNSFPQRRQTGGDRSFPVPYHK